MGTCNFYAKNHRGNIFRVSDTLIDDETGEEIQNDFLLEDTLECLGEIKCDFPLDTNGKDWDRDLDARVIADGDEWIRCYPNTDNDIIVLNFNAIIGLRGGYYYDANLDYDLEIHTNCCPAWASDTFRLSQYDNLSDFIDDVLDALEEGIDLYGREIRWTTGTFKIQRNHIAKWIEDTIENISDEIESVLSQVSDDTLQVAGRFSNGETVYSKVG